MQPFLTVRDKDIFKVEQNEEEVEYKLRVAVKGLVFDDVGRIALISRSIFLLPGGGVEEGESNKEALRRECKEEIGCDIEIDEEIGFTEEWRQKVGRHQKTYFFRAHVVGKKGEPETIEDNEQGMFISWHDEDEVLSLLEEMCSEKTEKQYAGSFNVRTNLAAAQRLFSK